MKIQKKNRKYTFKNFNVKSMKNLLPIFIKKKFVIRT